jgi:hypothetical protein
MSHLRSLRGHIDAVLFDVGGVLLVPHPKFLRPIAAEHGINAPDGHFVRGHYEGVRAMHLSSTTIDDWAVYNEAYAETLGATDPVTVGAALGSAMVGRSVDDRWWTHVLPRSRSRLES